MNNNKTIGIMHCIQNIMKSRKEWKMAVSWANKYHPTWVRLATQRKRPEIKETYRKKILRGYCDACL